MRLVVARFNEDLGWLAEVPQEWAIYVYNKGEPVEPPARCVVVQRPNVGREAETFAYHNAVIPAAQWTVFLQGNPFDHWGDPIADAQRIAARGDRVGWLGYHYDTAWNIPPHTVAHLDVQAVWNDLGMDGACPSRFSFPAGAQMVVHGSVIAKRHQAWWQRAAQVAASGDWRVAHCFERLWPSIYR